MYATHISDEEMPTPPNVSGFFCLKCVTFASIHNRVCMMMMLVLVCVTFAVVYNAGVSAWLITAPMPPPIRDGEMLTGKDMNAILGYAPTPSNRKTVRLSPAERDKNYRLGLLLLHMCNNPELAKFPFSDEFWGQLADMIQKERSRLTAKGTVML